MGTVVAIETEGGVVFAADTGAVDDSGVTSEGARRLFTFDEALAGAVGDQGAVDEFGRRVDAKLRELDVEAGRQVALAPFARLAADVADDLGVEAVVAARDEDGRARFRRIGPDGGTLGDSEKAAIGSGASVALGHLDGATVGPDLTEAVELARASVESVRDRDPETAADVDVAELASRE
jgi:proteasome beta subunit